MPVRTATATWNGPLQGGTGQMTAGSGAFNLSFSAGTRFGEDPGTNPEELIGAAHAGCFSMYLSAQLTNAGFAPKRIHTTATVHLEAGPTITRIELNTEAEVPGLDQKTFEEKVEVSKKNCPVSKALAAVPEVTVNARLV